MELDIKRITIDKKKYLFKYFKKNKEIIEPELISYFKSLVIPPAWTNVTISSDPNVKILAVGYDDKNRRQYRYNKIYIEEQECKKYKKKMIEFINILPKIYNDINLLLNKRIWNRNKVIAFIIKIIDDCHLRVGNDKYALENNSYGITTLKKSHIDINNNKITLNFIGKKGVENNSEITNPLLIKLFKNYYKTFNQQSEDDFFLYYDNDDIFKIDSSDINEYLKQYGDFTIKDFRTYSANEMLLKYFYNMYKYNNKLSNITQRKLKQSCNKCLDRVSTHLNNTRSICKKSYCSDYLINEYNNNPDDFIKKIKKYMKQKKEPFTGLQYALLKIFKDFKKN